MGYILAPLASPEEALFFEGTSYACPEVAGGAAIIYQALIDQGITPTPAQVKRILKASADDLGLEVTIQGAGKMNLTRALKPEYLNESLTSFTSYSSFESNWEQIEQTYSYFYEEEAA